MSLMNPGDEVDDNIWVRRPRNRLQPGQTQAPDPAARRVAGRAPTRSDTPAAALDPAASPSASSSLPPAPELAPAPELGLAASGEAAPRPRAPRARRDEPVLPVPEPELPSAPTEPRDDERVEPPSLPDGRSEGKPVWSVALMTFSGDDHRATAEAACRQFVQTIPELQGAFVRTRHNGSVLMWGEFDGPRDPRVKEQLTRLKQVTVAGNRPFARAMLARLEQFSEEEMGPWDLRQVRRKYPNVRVIYTLQVAAWSDLGSGTMTFEQIRRSAEEHCRKIRAQGVEAWYHHDADQLTSIVTVGVFDANAYDAQSTLYSREVEAMRKRFPVSLVNGVEIMIQGDPKRPEALVPQPSRLVEVPR